MKMFSFMNNRVMLKNIERAGQKERVLRAQREGGRAEGEREKGRERERENT